MVLCKCHGVEIELLIKHILSRLKKLLFFPKFCRFANLDFSKILTLKNLDFWKILTFQKFWVFKNLDFSKIWTFQNSGSGLFKKFYFLKFGFFKNWDFSKQLTFHKFWILQQRRLMLIKYSSQTRCVKTCWWKKILWSTQIAPSAASPAAPLVWLGLHDRLDVRLRRIHRPQWLACKNCRSPIIDPAQPHAVSTLSGGRPPHHQASGRPSTAYYRT